MKDEPWRGDKDARLLHLESKLANKKKRIRELETLLSKYKEIAEKLAGINEVPTDYDGFCLSLQDVKTLRNCVFKAKGIYREARNERSL